MGEFCRRRLLALVGAVAAGAAGCVGTPSQLGDGGTVVAGDPDASGDRIDPDVSSGTVASLADAQRAFALELHHELLAEDPAHDQVSSPLSVGIALAMTWTGARGQTADEMAAALRFPFEQDRLHEAVNGLMAELESRSDGFDDEDGDPPTVAITNALWPDDGLVERDFFEEAFLDTLARHYGTRPAPVPLTADQDEAAATINGWVEDATEGLIDQLVEASDLRAAVLVLTNALYFYGAWVDDFSQQATEEVDFHPLDGPVAQVPMMSKETRVPYIERDGVQAIELPYEGGEMGLMVILPTEGTFEAFEADFDRETLDDLVGSMEKTAGVVELPRFEVAADYDLQPPLEEFGMQQAFGGAADFTGMERETNMLFIDFVKHAALVRVDEDGTEAAAATAVGLAPVAGGPIPEFEFRVDHPFVFLVRDRPTGTILFIGRIVETPTDPGPP